MKWENEINLWASKLDGTYVWFKGAYLQDWHKTTNPAWDTFMIYVVDDKNAEFKKAWYDRAEVQYKQQDGSWIDKNPYEDGDVWDNSLMETYELRIKPKKWYENIPEEGVWCWVWDEGENPKMSIASINYYDSTDNCRLPFVNDRTCDSWRCAEPVEEWPQL